MLPLMGTPIDCKSNLMPWDSSTAVFKANSSEEKVLVAILFYLLLTDFINISPMYTSMPVADFLSSLSSA